MTPQEQIDALLIRVQALETKLTTRGIDNDLSEAIREAVFFDIDNTTATTRTATDSHFDTVTVPVNPKAFLVGYFRGKICKFAIY